MTDPLANLKRKAACWHQVLAPVQAYRVRGRTPLPIKHPGGGQTYALLHCLEAPGHEGDHRHVHVWSQRTVSDSP